MSSPATSSSSSSEESSDDCFGFPDDFPLDLDVYDQVDDYQPPLPPRVNPHDPRRRKFDSLYPLDWLVADTTNGGASGYPLAPIGRLRRQWQQAFQQNVNGDWNYVEYVPAWSDPDWTSRYTYIRQAADENIDEIARQYAKPGMLQTQRPAMRPNDASLNPTEAAKRWGVYPWPTWDGLDGHVSLKGWSGVTPRMPGFPTVQLDQPRFSPDAGGLVAAVTMDDLASERQRLEGWRKSQGLQTTDEDFRQSLADISIDPKAGPIKTEKAASLLALLEAVQRIEEREEYQRLLFGGNTTNELVEQGAWTLGADASTDLANPLHDLLSRNWDEFIDICASGFDTTSYVCEILKHTIEWDIRSKWRIASTSNDKGAASGDSDSAYGATFVHRVEDPSSQTPFKIKIHIAAELIWPLLADEYSMAEKASTTMYIAVTMLHEISHALILARCQMLMPGTLDPGDEPLWLLIKPSWRQELANFNAQHNMDILDALQSFGDRMEHEESAFEDDGIFFPSHEIYWQTEPTAEEGWATENQQYFGGIFETLPSASVGSFPNFDHFRFLEEATYIVAMRGWETDSGFEGRFSVHGALAMSEYQRMYSQRWWDSDFVVYGPAALKMFNTKAPIRGILNLTMLHLKTLWDLVGKRYGDDACDWLRMVWRRVKDATENQFLWRYLLYQTIVSTEAEACEQVWFDLQKHWDLADIAVWNDRSAAISRGAELEAALDMFVDRNTDTVYDWNAERPASEFRRFSAALWHTKSVLSREATYFQNVAVTFIVLDDRAAKDRLFRLYAERLRTRIANLYLRVCNDTSQLLDGLDNMNTTRPNITSWLTSSPDIACIWNRDAVELKETIRIISQYFNVVLGVFSADPAQRTATVDELGAIPSGAAKTLAGRVKRIAMRQYRALSPTDPRKKIADEWSHIMTDGDLLRNPSPNSLASVFNQRLHNGVVNIDAGIAAHQRVVSNAHPDPQMLRQIVDSPALLNQQPRNDGSFDRTKILTREEEEAAFTLASGFQPYRDATTGFTRFEDKRAYQPSLRHQQQVTPQTPQQQNQENPAAYHNALDHRIKHTAAQLRQMSQPQGQPVDLATPAPMIFGSAAAQQGQAMQQIEGFVGQRAATGRFSTPAQQQQFLDDQALWRQNDGT
ncbi:hypothetical protein N0V82_010023 [Gnomoniopsis sp. IMI 355080]|nr:hypothetical protein N0V82_010023 [Gnomoniopsis sp. IMI 355080]